MSKPPLTGIEKYDIPHLLESMRFYASGWDDSPIKTYVECAVDIIELQQKKIAELEAIAKVQVLALCLASDEVNKHKEERGER
jgi:hypothetical protein